MISCRLSCAVAHVRPAIERSELARFVFSSLLVRVSWRISVVYFVVDYLEIRLQFHCALLRELACKTSAGNFRNRIRNLGESGCEGGVDFLAPAVSLQGAVQVEGAKATYSSPSADSARERRSAVLARLAQVSHSPSVHCPFRQPNSQWAISSGTQAMRWLASQSLSRMRVLFDSDIRPAPFEASALATVAQPGSNRM